MHGLSGVAVSGDGCAGSLGRLSMTSEDYSTIEIDSLTELPSSITRLATEITNRVLPLQRASTRAWSEIRIELWIDSGRVIAFPAEAEAQERTDVGGCQVCCAELQQVVSDLDVSSLADSDHDAQFRALESRIAAIVRARVTHEFETFSIRDPDGNQL